MLFQTKLEPSMFTAKESKVAELLYGAASWFALQCRACWAIALGLSSSCSETLASELSALPSL